MLVYMKRTSDCHTCYTASNHGVNWSNPAPNNSKATLSRNQAVIVRRALQENSFRRGRISFLASRTAEWAAASSTPDMLHASLPAHYLDTDNVSNVLCGTHLPRYLYNSGKLRGVFPMALLLRWAGIILKTRLRGDQTSSTCYWSVSKVFRSLTKSYMII